MYHVEIAWCQPEPQLLFAPCIRVFERRSDPGLNVPSGRSSPAPRQTPRGVVHRLGGRCGAEVTASCANRPDLRLSGARSELRAGTSVALARRPAFSGTVQQGATSVANLSPAHRTRKSWVCNGHHRQLPLQRGPCRLDGSIHRDPRAGQHSGGGAEALGRHHPRNPKGGQRLPNCTGMLMATV